MPPPRGPPRIASVQPRNRGVKGMRRRISYQPYAHETKWFKIKKRSRAKTEDPDDKHFVFEAFWQAAYQAPRTCDLVYAPAE